MPLHHNAELSSAIPEPADIKKYERAMHLSAVGGWVAISEGSFVVHVLFGSDFASCALESGAVGFALLMEYARHEQVKPYKEALADDGTY